MEFRKRVVAVIAPVPVEKQQESDTASEQEGSDEESLDIVVRRGRRTGVRMKKQVPKDLHGLERLSEFWSAEEQSTRLSLASNVGSVATEGSILSHASATSDSLPEDEVNIDSFADSRSVDTSAQTQHEEDSDDGEDANDVSDSGRTPASTDRSRSVVSSSGASRVTASATPSSSARSTRSSTLRSSVARSSAAASSNASASSSLLDSPSDTKLLGDSPSGGLDASKQRLTFGSSDKRLSTLSTESISPSESEERSMKRRSRVSFADSSTKRKSSVSFAKTPRGRDSTATAATQSPVSEQEDEPDEMADAPRFVCVACVSIWFHSP